MLLGNATLILAIAHFALYVGAAKAAELDGGWISNPDACAEVFTVKDGKTSLSTSADFYGSGFVTTGRSFGERLQFAKSLRESCPEKLFNCRLLARRTL